MRAAAWLVAFAWAARAAAEPLALVDLAGRPVALAPAPGAALVVHFWATWCPSCQQELGDLARAAAACREGAVEVVAVDVGEAPSAVAEFLAKRPLALRVLIDPKGRAWRAGGGREVPANLIWTAERQSWTLGPSSESQWRERLAAVGCTASRDFQDGARRLTLAR
jgi:thiol-disulfide isomerase/thioredoxin